MHSRHYRCSDVDLEAVNKVLVEMLSDEGITHEGLGQDDMQELQEQIVLRQREVKKW